MSEGRVAPARNAAFLHAPLWPVGHLPLKGGDQSRRRRRSSSTVARISVATSVIGCGVDDGVISPLGGEMAGRPERGVTKLLDPNFSSLSAALPEFTQ